MTEPSLRAGVQKAIAALENAVSSDPAFGRAYAGLGWAYWQHFAMVDSHAQDSLRKAFDLAEKSIDIADNALAHRILAKRHHAPDTINPGLTLGLQTNFESALIELEKARALEPNNPDVLADLAYTLAFAGRAEEANVLMERAKRLDPNYPEWYAQPSGIARFLTQDFSRAVADFKEWNEHDPQVNGLVSRFWLASAQAHNGNTVAAKATLEPWFKYYPAMTLIFVKTALWKFQQDEDLELFLEGLRLAGLPDGPE